MKRKRRISTILGIFLAALLLIPGGLSIKAEEGAAVPDLPEETLMITEEAVEIPEDPVAEEPILEELPPEEAAPPVEPEVPLEAAPPSEETPLLPPVEEPVEEIAPPVEKAIPVETSPLWLLRRTRNLNF